VLTDGAVTIFSDIEFVCVKPLTVVGVLTNFDHYRQWFDTPISPSHESAAVYFVCRTFWHCDVTLEWTREVMSTLYHAIYPL